MILRNLTFEHDLEFKDDYVHTLVIRSPNLLARTVQSMVDLQDGNMPPEPFKFIEKDKVQDGTKLLHVVSDPFHIDVNGRRELASLYAKLENLLAQEP